MPRPARHDQLPRLTGLINWELLGSRADGANGAAWDIQAPAAGDDGLPCLGTGGLPLPNGFPDAAGGSGSSQDHPNARSCIEALPDHVDATLESRPVRYSRSMSTAGPSHGPVHENGTRDRLQQCLQTLHSVGFPSVEAFALEYYTSRLGSSVEASVTEEQRGLSTFGHLVLELQHASLRGDPVEAMGLHHGIAKAACNLYISELRSLDRIPYSPQEAEHQLPYLYLLLRDLLTQVGCPPDLVDAAVRNSIQGLLKSGSVS